MSIENLCTPWGIVNGSMGTVQDVILNDENEIEYILVQFNDIIEEEMNNYKRLIKNVPRLIPIPKEVHTYTPEKGEYAGEKFWKCQFGLTLGYSFCIEKIQGASISHNTFIDIGDNEKPGIG